MVVDPQRDTNQYTDDARRLGLTIRHVVLTHLHADFVSGHLELQHREGASIHLGRRATAEYPFAPRRQGACLVFMGALECAAYPRSGPILRTGGECQGSRSDRGATSRRGALDRPDWA